MKKNQLFLMLFVAVFGLSVTNVVAYDVIREEDEDLIKDIISIDDNRFIVEESKSNVIYENQAPKESRLEKDEILIIDEISSSNSLSYGKNEEKVEHPSDFYARGGSHIERQAEKEFIITPDGEEVELMQTREDFIDGINSCLDTRIDELDQLVRYYNMGDTFVLGDISSIFSSINECYVDMGYAIIENKGISNTYLIDKFNNDIKEFYVSGSDVNFNPKYCGETCSVGALIDAQIARFADFRVYLTKLLDYN